MAARTRAERWKHARPHVKLSLRPAALCVSRFLIQKHWQARQKQRNVHAVASVRYAAHRRTWQTLRKYTRNLK